MDKTDSPEKWKLELVNFADMTPEGTRPARGFKVWFPLKLYGTQVFRDYLQEKLDLTKWIYGEMEKLPELEMIGGPPILSVINFSHVSKKKVDFSFPSFSTFFGY